MPSRKGKVKKAPATRKGTTPSFSEYPKWTEAAFFSFLRSGLRAKWTRWPPKYEVLANAKRPSQSANKRLKYEFQCNQCKGWFPQKEVSVDHIEPVGTLRTFEDLPEFCRRLFVGTDKLQCLCSVCHRIKTNEETAARKKHKDK